MPGPLAGQAIKWRNLCAKNGALWISYFIGSGIEPGYRD